MPTGYAWIESGKFKLSLFPAGSAHRSHNTYDTPEAVKAATDQAGLALQWDDPQAVAAWIKARSENAVTATVPQSNGTTPVPQSNSMTPVEVIPPSSPVPRPAPAPAPAPAPSVSPIAAAMSVTPAKSTASGMLTSLQGLKDVVAAMNAEQAQIAQVTALLQTKLGAVQDMRKTLQDFADKLTV